MALADERTDASVGAPVEASSAEDEAPVDASPAGAEAPDVDADPSPEGGASDTPVVEVDPSTLEEGAEGRDERRGGAPSEDGAGPDETAATGEVEPEEPPPAPQPDPLAEAERQRDEYLELARRTQADFENYRKRAAREAAAAGQRAKSGLVRELLPVIDNLERALESAGDADDGLAQGVRLVLSELVGVLDRSGVTSFEPTGEPFDPTVHEAISTREAEGTESGVVVDVVEKGYRLDETVIRPARVVVSA